MQILEIGKIIERRRKELAITQTRLAELSGVGNNTISRIENGQMNPQIDTLEKIATILGMELRLEVKKINV